MWNTITIQYNPLIEEEWDEHFKVSVKQQLDLLQHLILTPIIDRSLVNTDMISGKQSLFLF